MEMFDEADFDYSKFGFKEIKKQNDVIYSFMKVDKDSKEFEKGLYKILSCHNLYLFSKAKLKYIEHELFLMLKNLVNSLKIKKGENILIVGLGNQDIISDSLGFYTCKKILASKSFDNLKSNVSTLCPSVESLTGIDTFDTVCGVAKQIKAKLIILIDSLLTNDINRLGHSFQMSSCGMVPGGALKNNKEISYNTTNIKCISIGVPFMLSMKEYSKQNLIVAPKDIKSMIKLCSTLLANAINMCFNNELSTDEILELLN